MDKDTALDLALEALEVAVGDDAHDYQKYLDAITAIKQARSAPVQELVVWQYRDANYDGTWSAWVGCDKRLTESTWREVRPLYTTPPAQRQWVGLTDEEIKHMLELFVIPPHHVEMVVQAIEAKLKEKNT